MKKEQLKNYIAKLEAYKKGELTDYIKDLKTQLSSLDDRIATKGADTEPPNPPPNPPHFP